jgi:DNA-binding transcriptional LysR family regulator
VIEVDSQDTLVELIRDGRAQSIMSYSGVLRPKQRGEVVARRIVNPTLDREIGTAFPNNRSPTHLMRGVEEELHQLAHELAPTARWTIP